MSHTQLVLPPQENSALLQLNDLTGYKHHFCLSFVLPDGQLTPVSSETFEFGTAIANTQHVVANMHFDVSLTVLYESMCMLAYIEMCIYYAGFTQIRSTFKFSLDLSTTVQNGL